MNSEIKRSKLILAPLLIILLVAAGLATPDRANASADGNLISNGGFESGTKSWKSNNVDVVVNTGPTSWFVYDGTTALDLNGSDSGSISQTFDTAPDHRFRAAFRIAGNPQCGSGAKTLVASAGDNTGTFFSIDSAGEPIANLAWAEQQFFFTSDDVKETISFVSITTGIPCGAMLDAIEVTDLGPVLPTTVAECKKSGWEQYGVFKNQGDCVSYVVTHGRNLPAGG